MIIYNERHLKRVLRHYINENYNISRTNLSLDEDCPEPRDIETPEVGKVIEIPILGGLYFPICFLLMTQLYDPFSTKKYIVLTELYSYIQLPCAESRHSQKGCTFPVQITRTSTPGFNRLRRNHDTY